MAIDLSGLGTPVQTWSRCLYRAVPGTVRASLQPHSAIGLIARFLKQNAPLSGGEIAERRAAPAGLRSTGQNPSTYSSIKHSHLRLILY